MRFDWSKKAREARAAESASLLPGERVETWLDSWGDGVVVSNVPDRTWRDPLSAQPNRRRRAKPLLIRRDDGTEGWFNYEYVRRAGEREPHAYLLLVHGEGGLRVPRLDPAHPEDLTCPVCHRNLDGEQWADDGEADLADWFRCPHCGVTGALVRTDEPHLTLNGVEARG